MINPKTSKKENKYDMLVVISNDNLTANMVANTIYFMNKEDGENFAKQYNSEVLWQKEDKIYQTKEFEKYILKK